MFLGMSIAGILFHGYFFAFHLLNIVNNNQLLGGVIKAVTVNGKPGWKKIDNVYMQTDIITCLSCVDKYIFLEGRKCFI